MAASFQLVMQKGPTPGKVFELTQDDMTIGRDISNRIVINDPEVSRKHSRLSLQGGAYVIEDLGSTNGTLVNGQRLMGPHVLRPGETVMLGEKIVLNFEGVGYDPNATVVGNAPLPPPRETVRVAPAQDYGAPAAPAYAYPPQPVEQQQAYPAAYPAAPAYGGQVPQGPVDPYAAAPAEMYEQPYDAPPPKSNTTRNLIIAGCGCLVVLMCCMVVAGFAFDTLNLYCETPFKLIFSCP
jgi:pSer/pThr/pTyr-binding forkhead associated (FHA) protein